MIGARIFNEPLQQGRGRGDDELRMHPCTGFCHCRRCRRCSGRGGQGLSIRVRALLRLLAALRLLISAPAQSRVVVVAVAPLALDLFLVVHFVLAALQVVITGVKLGRLHERGPSLGVGALQRSFGMVCLVALAAGLIA